MHHLMRTSLAGSQIVLCGVRDRDLENLAPKLRAFAPDILIFSGWHVLAYRRAARGLANKCWRVMAMDGCWLATLKQRIGAWTAPYFLHPLADAVWLPGERQAAFAQEAWIQAAGHCSRTLRLRSTCRGGGAYYAYL